MEKAKIQPSQMFKLIVLFEMGSSLLLSPGADAKQDAWMTVIFGMAGGVLLFFLYYRLFKYYPDLPLTGYLQKILGKWPGRAIGILYVIYFIYMATRVLRDFGDLLTTTVYTVTPLIVINSLMVLSVIYAIYKGFEVIARVCELFFILIYMMAIVGFFLILFSGLIHLEYLMPILENGWGPVIKTTLEQTMPFPFGEMIVFTMLLPYINKPEKVKVVYLGGMILAGINITITTVVNIASLGPALFARANFPLLTTVGKIQLANFIERLDVLFMLYLVIGGFFKVTIFFYAAAIGTADIFKFDHHNRVTYPIGFIILFASVTVAANYAEHIKEGLQLVPIYLHWPLQIFIPTMLLVIAFIKNKLTKGKMNSAGSTGGNSGSPQSNIGQQQQP